MKALAKEKEEREDFAIGFSKNIAGSFIGRVNAGTSKYWILNEETKDIEYAKTVDFGIGFGIPVVSASGSIILLIQANIQENLAILEELTNKKENINKNIVKISKISNEIEKSLEEGEVLWRYNPQMIK